MRVGAVLVLIIYVLEVYVQSKSEGHVRNFIPKHALIFVIIKYIHFF